MKYLALVFLSLLTPALSFASSSCKGNYEGKSIEFSIIGYETAEDIAFGSKIDLRAGFDFDGTDISYHPFGSYPNLVLTVQGKEVVRQEERTTQEKNAAVCKIYPSLRGVVSGGYSAITTLLVEAVGSAHFPESRLLKVHCKTDRDVEFNCEKSEKL